MNGTATRIKCAKCSSRANGPVYHPDIAAVRACQLDQRPAPAPTVPAAVAQPGLSSLYRGEGYATTKQIAYANDLAGYDFARSISELSWQGARKQISHYLSTHPRSKPVSNDPRETAPNRQQSKIPQMFLEQLPDGYYAARPDDNAAFTFFRVSRPKKNRMAGSIKIQTQHGDKLKEVMVLWPKRDGEAERRVSIYDLRIEDDLLLVCVDPRGAGQAYAQELNHCCNCGKDLTDPRSRWYGIGPDCETRRQDVMDAVEFTKGRFRG